MLNVSNHSRLLILVVLCDQEGNDSLTDQVCNHLDFFLFIFLIGGTAVAGSLIFWQELKEVARAELNDLADHSQTGDFTGHFLIMVIFSNLTKGLLRSSL